MDAEINNTIINTLLPFHPKQISVFGSYARGEMDEKSDIDILVDFNRGITYFDIGGIYMELQEKLKRQIDLVLKDGLNPIIRPHIEKDLKEIYHAG